MGYPEPNFGIKDRKLGIKDLEGVRQKNHQNHVKKGFECAQRSRSVLWAVFFSPAALFLVRSMELSYFVKLCLPKIFYDVLEHLDLVLL